MHTTATESPLLVIVGETASGKSALAIQLAQQFGGEIICADSRTVYEGLNIGTAKPKADDQELVSHYGLDLVEPGERFTVADFKAYAQQKIGDISERGHLPILVGGSGLYIDAVLYDYQFRPAASTELRAELDALSVEELQQRILQKGIALPANDRNPRHLIRTLETGGQQAASGPLRPDTLILGLQLEREVLRERITARVDTMIAEGFIEEANAALAQYGPNCPALQAPGYKAFQGYVEGTKTLQEATADFVKNDMDLAKRQRTWFRRNKSIHWLVTDDKYAEAVDFATTFLNK